MRYTYDGRIPPTTTVCHTTCSTGDKNRRRNLCHRQESPSVATMSVSVNTICVKVRNEKEYKVKPLIDFHYELNTESINS